MTSDRQFAANRRNAHRSTGPRSDAGRKRSSLNSFRHGLAAAGTVNAERIKHIERLARNIAGANTDIVTLECARAIAQAEFELAQIRRMKVALVSRVMAFGEVKKASTWQLIAEAQAVFPSARSRRADPSKPRSSSDANNRARAHRRSRTACTAGIDQARPLRAPRCSSTRAISALLFRAH
jgi:hypothetical protein